MYCVVLGVARGSGRSIHTNVVAFERFSSLPCGKGGLVFGFFSLSGVGRRDGCVVHNGLVF